MNDYQSFNKVFLIGRVGADPELKRTQGKHPQDFVRFSIATYKKWSSGTKSTTWTQVSYWGDNRAAWAKKYVTKGARILIEGSIETRIWKDNTGNSHRLTEVKAEKIIFIGSPRDKVDIDGNGEQQEGRQPQATAHPDDQVSEDQLPDEMETQDADDDFF